MLTYMKGLWVENQILEALPGAETEEVLRAVDPNYQSLPINLCQQPLTNALGNALLGRKGLSLSWEETKAVTRQLRTADDLEDALGEALERVCRDWAFPPACAAYARALTADLCPRLEAALTGGDVSRVFLPTR